jgi:hypothetical protein
MAQFDITVDCPVFDSFRVRQVAGLFDVPLQQRAREHFSAEVPGLDEPWELGVIVGPSGAGKSTIARAAFGDKLYEASPWPADCAVVDCFGSLPIKLVTRVLTAVGLSSAPAWLKPHAVLSNGEKFRCELARALLLGGDLVAFDEFSSVVDRTVAKIASAATAKAIRFQPPLGIVKRFVAVTCHYDVVDWLEPDWVLDMASRTLARGRLRRPRIELHCSRTDRSLWEIFKRHHYLTGPGTPGEGWGEGNFERKIAQAWRGSLRNSEALPPLGITLTPALSRNTGRGSAPPTSPDSAVDCALVGE